MPFSTPSTILVLAAIPVKDIVAFSSCYDMNAQTIIAQSIEHNYGIEGLRSLWLCQGFQYNESDTSGCLPATTWWLDVSNPFSQRLQEDFNSVTTIENANMLLGLAARSPKRTFAFEKNGGMIIPDDCDDTKSLLWAVNVRRLAQRFFSHIPEVASPFNDLYFHSYETLRIDESGYCQWDFIYRDPVGAFMDNTNALKYFAARNLGHALPELPPQWLMTFYKNGDLEWNMYKTLGLTMENAYLLATRPGVAVECLDLPEDLNSEPLALTPAPCP